MHKTLNNQQGGGALILTMITVLLLSAIISQMPTFLANSAKDYGQARKAADALNLQHTIAKVVLDARRLGREAEENGTNCSSGYYPLHASGTNNLFCFQDRSGDSTSCVKDYSQDGSDVCLDKATNQNDDHVDITFNFDNNNPLKIVAKAHRNKIEVFKYNTYHALNSFFKKLEEVDLYSTAYANDGGGTATNTAQNIFEPAAPVSTIRNDVRAPDCPPTGTNHPLCQRCDAGNDKNCMNIEVDDDKYGKIYQQFIVEI